MELAASPDAETMATEKKVWVGTGIQLTDRQVMLACGPLSD